MTLKKALRPHRTRAEREGELTRTVMGKVMWVGRATASLVGWRSVTPNSSSSGFIPRDAGDQAIEGR